MALPRRVSPAAYRRVTGWVVFFMGFVIVTGAAVRLTGSGLGCPKWPTCTSGDVVSPLSYHPLVEFINRVITLAVSIAIMVVALAAFLRQPRRRDLSLLSLGLVVGLVAEIILGGVTVEHRLNPGFVMAHFLLAIALLWNAVVLQHRASLPDGEPHRPLVDRDLIRVGRLLAVMVLATVVAGTVVTGSGPHSGANASDGEVRRWHLSLHRVTQVHGTCAMVTLALIVATWWLLRSRQAPHEAQHRLQLLIEAIAIQITIGYTQYFAGVPAFLVAFHIVGAVLVWTAVLRFALALSSGVGTGPAGQQAGVVEEGVAGDRSRSPART
jgi:heme a synthase